MPMPPDVRDAAVARVERFCAEHSPESSAGEYRIEHALRGTAITLVERRTPWRPGPGDEWTAQEIAQLRYDESARTWTLYWRRHTGRWLRYDGVTSARGLEPLLAEIDADPEGVFWG
jgi:Protein of unknown function (DUF3024)